jgi:uncharacterized protein
MSLPSFRYHPDPVLSGGVVASDATCDVCKHGRGYVYAAQPYGEDVDDDVTVCPWCVADGSAHAKLGAEFTDYEAFEEGVPEAAQKEIVERTPGFATWQDGAAWPACCGDAMAFVEPVGTKDIKAKYLKVEGAAMMYIVHQLGISGGAATRLLNTLDRDKGPTGYVFRCLACEAMQLRIDRG